MRSATRSYATSDTKGGIVLRAAGDTPLSIWIDNAPESAASVDYFARRVPPDSPRVALGCSESREDGFAIRHEFARSGDWEIWCEVSADTGVTKSDVLRVSIEMVLEPRLLEYATDGTRNLPAGADAQIAASSRVEELRSGKQTFDNLQATFWESRSDDAEPWITVRLPKPVSANRLLVSHPRNLGARTWLARADKLAVKINARHRFEIEMPAERDAKAVLELPKRIRIGSIHVRIVSSVGRLIPRDSVGIGEIELQRVDR